MKLLALRCSILVLALVTAHSVGANADGAPLTIQQRKYLEKALTDSTLARWQRTAATGLLAGRAASLSASVHTNHPLLPSPASVDGEWSSILLQGISGHAAVYDLPRDRMLVFGGAHTSGLSNEVWALSMTGNPPWTKIEPTGSLPMPRAGHTAIYDPVRDRMLIFGGYGAGMLNDVWALSLSGSPSWSQLVPIGTAPEGGWGYSAIYDAVRDRMIVYGSMFSSSSDVWALSLSGTPEWTKLATSGKRPSARAGHTSIYDATRDRMVIFGGDDGSYPDRNDTWALYLSGTPTWVPLDTTATLPGRAWHTAIYDGGRDRMVIFGGTNVGGRSRLSDTWAFSMSGTPTWTELNAGGLPKARMSHTAIYDPVRVRMVVFGGDDDVYIPDLNDVWSLPLQGSPEWFAGPGSAPAARHGHTAIYDRARDRMVVFGGGWDSFNDVWALSLSGSPEWTLLSPAGNAPPGGAGYTAVYDPSPPRMVVFGGNDTWMLSLSENPTWTYLGPLGTKPPSRNGQTAIYDPVRDRMVICGGYDWPTSFNDVWALSLSGTPEWTQLSPTGVSPPARYGGHSAIYDPARDRMVIFGGVDTTYPYPQRNDVWALSLSGTPAWAELTPAGTLVAPRESHTAIYDPLRDRMVVFGGNSSSAQDADPWALSLSGIPEWVHLLPTGPTPGRESHTAIYDPARDRMVIFAGVADMHSDWEDVWQLHWGAVTRVQPKLLADALRPCYPNPFNPSVTIPFELGENGSATLSVYDASGRLVRNLLNEWTSEGLHTIRWDGSNESGKQAPSGVYFCRLRTSGVVYTRKIVMLK